MKNQIDENSNEIGMEESKEIHLIDMESGPIHKIQTSSQQSAIYA